MVFLFICVQGIVGVDGDPGDAGPTGQGVIYTNKNMVFCKPGLHTKLQGLRIGHYNAENPFCLVFM